MSRFQIYAIILAVITVGWATMITLNPAISTGLRIAEDFHGVPMNISGWHAEATHTPDAASVYDQLRTCSLLSRKYYGPNNEEVDLSIVMGLELGDFHQPEVCMGGAGWRAIKKDTVMLHPASGTPHEGTLVTLRNDMVGDIYMLYWFYMAGRVSPTLGGSKLKQAFTTMFTKPQPCSMVKFVSIIGSDENESKKAVITMSDMLEPDIVTVARKAPQFEDYRKVFERLPPDNQAQ